MKAPLGIFRERPDRPASIPVLPGSGSIGSPSRTDGLCGTLPCERSTPPGIETRRRPPPGGPMETTTHPRSSESDPLHHTSNIKGMLDDLIKHLREDIRKFD